MGLIEFVASRLDEDEATARRNSDPHGLSHGYPDYQTYADDDTAAADAYIERFSPVRVLREVEAGRQILAEHEPTAGRCQTCSAVAAPPAGSYAVMMSWPCRTVRALAAVWSGHPDYDPAWR